MPLPKRLKKTDLMRLADFHYDLPEELIAREPLKERSACRLLHVPRNGNSLSHHVFRELSQFLKAGDVLVVNDTRVLPARLLGQRPTGGQIEVLLIQPAQDGQWEVLVRPSGKVRRGTRLQFGENGCRLEAEILDDPRENTGQRRVAFDVTGSDFLSRLEAVGHMPLPPYIQRPDQPQDREDYQTVFARQSGAVAAPTAGLHFDAPLMAVLAQQGVQMIAVTLHVGYGTFQPITDEHIQKGELFEEVYDIPDEAARILNRAYRENRRVIACGTTTVRALESSLDAEGNIRSGRYRTSLFIRPPQPVKSIQGLITNFHLPESSLMMLVAAFLESRERLLNAYQEAVLNRYRFYSYGDAMLIL